MMLLFSDSQEAPGEYDDLGTTGLGQSTTRYQIVNAAKNLALDLLETRKGRESLTLVARKIIQECRRDGPGQAFLKFRGTDQDIPQEIRRFLRKLRSEFPDVYLTDQILGEAVTVRTAWPGSIRNYRARDAGILYLRRTLVENAVYAHRQQMPDPEENYTVFKFQLTIIIAHEIIHFLYGFLVDTAQPERRTTPPAVVAGGYGERSGRGAGESGRYWEELLLGGFVEYWSSPRPGPSQTRKPGQPFLFSHARDGTARAVSMDYIRRFVGADFEFPIRPSATAQEVTRIDLRGASRVETSELREPRRLRRAPDASSPPSDHPSRNEAYRRNPSYYYGVGVAQSSYAQPSLSRQPQGSSQRSYTGSGGYVSSGYSPGTSVARYPSTQSGYGNPPYYYNDSGASSSGRYRR